MTHSKPELPVSETIGRFARAGGAQPEIDREGGKFGAGIIRGVSLCQVGEALGHQAWCDQRTIDAVAELSAKTGNKGLKCRFTHPGMSSDGMGRHLGRLQDVTADGDKAVGDLHFAKSAHETPEGNLAEYVMSLTEEDPAAAGLSIVFHHDQVSEEAFAALHGGDEFESPDPANEHNYRHVRIAELRAADVVDEPAANRDGMFNDKTLAHTADEMLSFAAGVSDKRPSTSSFGVDADRGKQFFARWLSSHGLSLVPMEADMPDENLTESADPAPPTREDFAAELATFNEAFGAENGSKWFSENKTFAEGMALHCESLTEKLSAETERAEQAEQRLASLSLGEESELETGSTSQTDEKKVPFSEYTKPNSN